MFTPIIQILQIDFPELDLIHSVSTGYGGLLGAAISAKSDIPFILTEHGIYSREREEEILQSTWIPIEYKKDGFLSSIIYLTKHMNKLLM